MKLFRLRETPSPAARPACAAVVFFAAALDLPDEVRAVAAPAQKAP